ncbi:MAG: HAD family hydrolase [Planctomycetota bacterium]
MKALILDFDGVISDSAAECFLVALRTYVGLTPDSALSTVLAEVSPNGALRAERIVAHDVYQSFIELMPLGNRAEDFGVIMMLVEMGADVSDQAAYDEQMQREDPTWLERFHIDFYQVRHQLADAQPEAWRQLMRPFPSFVELLRRRADEATLALATAKDRRSVMALLHDYAIDDLFDERLVADKEAGVRKTAHVRRLLELLAIDAADATFVDDKVNHLDSVAELGVRCALAGWGYNGTREHRLAEQRGYIVCSETQVEAQLFGASAR